MNDKIFHPFFVKTHIDRNDGKIYHIYIYGKMWIILHCCIITVKSHIKIFK